MPSQILMMAEPWLWVLREKIMGPPSCILEREDLEWRECQQEIRVGHGT